MNEAIEKIAYYLTGQFMVQQSDYPEDECKSEAEHILKIIYELGYRLIPKELKVLGDKELFVHIMGDDLADVFQPITIARSGAKAQRDHDQEQLEREGKDALT